MTNKDLLRIAMEQSAADIGCRPDDFLADNNAVVPFQLNADAKKYYKLPIACNFVSYGNNIVAAATDDVSDIVKEYIGKFEFYHCFETPNLHWLNERLASKGYAVCFMAEYYLPNLSRLSELPCSYTLRMLEKNQFEGLYLPKWANA